MLGLFIRQIVTTTEDMKGRERKNDEMTEYQMLECRSACILRNECTLEMHVLHLELPYVPHHSPFGDLTLYGHHILGDGPLPRAYKLQHKQHYSH